MVALALASALVAIGGIAYAVAPPANTVIGNQASASYLDPNGNSQITTSNRVDTTVQQVGSFTLDTVSSVTTTVINTKIGAASATVIAPHVLTNTGNGSDGFNITVKGDLGNVSKIAVYPDADFNGVADSVTALCSITTTTNTCTVPTQTVDGNNGQFGFVVAYTIPSTALTPTTPFDTATITATPVTTSLYTAANSSAANKDEVNLTTQAAFNVTKSLTLPASGTTAPGGGAWPVATSTGQRSSGAACSTTWAGGLSSSATCQYTVYTFSYSNSGGASGRFNLQDTIGAGATSGITYVAGSAVWSNSPGVAMGDAAGGDPAGVDFQVSGNVLTFVDNTVPVNTTRSVSFVVLVNNTAAVGTSTTNNQGNYNPNNAALATAAAPVGLTTFTNFAPFTVTGSYKVVLGSTAQLVAGAGNTDTTAGTPNGNTTAGDDTARVASAPSGGQVSYTVRIWNEGNASDVVDLLAVSPGTAGGTAFPSGTTYQFYAADGSTPLADSNSNSTIDTGVIAANSFKDVIVKATIPGASPAATGPFSLTVTGTSSGNPGSTDATRQVLGAVTGPLVDLTATAAGSTAPGSGDSGVGPSVSPTTTNAITAGSTTTFTLFVQNNDSAMVSYSLSSSGSSAFPGNLPAGWSVKYTASGTTAATCAAAPAITSLSVAAGAQGDYVACLTPPANAALGTQPVYFQVSGTGSNGGTVIDTLYNAVTVSAPVLTYTATLAPNNNGQVAAGGSVTYTHSLANTGSGMCAAGAGETYTVTATLPATEVLAGWTVALYRDTGNGVFDDASTDPLITGPLAGQLAVASTRVYFVKVFAPGGALANAQATVTVTADFSGNAIPCNTASATDISTIVTGQIRLDKTQALDALCDGIADAGFAATPISGKPGQCILYRVIATNQGLAQVNNIFISDSVPTWTAISGASQPATQCQSANVTPALTTAANYATSASSVSCGSTANTVAPGGTAQLDFAVKINQ
ncbi:MAG: hypothetical protein V4857_04445 [Pseudomonadota bacterium]